MYWNISVWQIIYSKQKKSKKWANTFSQPFIIQPILTSHMDTVSWLQQSIDPQSIHLYLWCLRSLHPFMFIVVNRCENCSWHHNRVLIQTSPELFTGHIQCNYTQFSRSVSLYCNLAQWHSSLFLSFFSPVSPDFVPCLSPMPLAFAPFSSFCPYSPHPSSSSSNTHFSTYRRRSLQTAGSWGGQRAPPHLWKEIAPSLSMTWPCSVGRCFLRFPSRPSWAGWSAWGERDLGPGRWLAPGRLLFIEVSM